MKTIDHNPQEFTKPPMVWPFVALLVGFAWFSYLYFNTPDWWSIGLGFMTAAAVFSWAFSLKGES